MSIMLVVMKMKTIWIATSNMHKVEEFQNMLQGRANVKCLKDLDKKIEIVEDGKTFEENALIDQSSKKALGMIRFFIIHRFKQL